MFTFFCCINLINFSDLSSSVVYFDQLFVCWVVVYSDQLLGASHTLVISYHDKWNLTITPPIKTFLTFKPFLQMHIQVWENFNWATKSKSTFRFHQWSGSLNSRHPRSRTPHSRHSSRPKMDSTPKTGTSKSTSRRIHRIGYWPRGRIRRGPGLSLNIRNCWSGKNC